MNTYTIQRDIDIDAPVDIVWRTITEPDRIRMWFGDEADLQAKPGAEGSLTFRGDGTGDPKVVNITAVAVEQPHRFSFRWVYPPGDQATADNSMLVTFTLTEDSDRRTRLRVVETGLDRPELSDDDKQTYVEEHTHGWQVCGDRLRDLFVAQHEPSS